MKTKSKRDPGKQPVTTAKQLQIKFQNGQAREVCLAGTFNDWHPAMTPMLHLGHDGWVKALSLLPGRYEYCFVVDGQWICDPSTAEKVPNPFGGFNSVLIVG